ncbi:1032_t:CDS:2, partial [Gigaspora margarita]
ENETDLFDDDDLEELNIDFYNENQYNNNQHSDNQYIDNQYSDNQYSDNQYSDDLYLLVTVIQWSINFESGLMKNIFIYYSIVVTKIVETTVKVEASREEAIKECTIHIDIS